MLAPTRYPESSLGLTEIPLDCLKPIGTKLSTFFTCAYAGQAVRPSPSLSRFDASAKTRYRSLILVPAAPSARHPVAISKSTSSSIHVIPLSPSAMCSCFGHRSLLQYHFRASLKEPL